MYKEKYIIGIYSYDKYELCETILESIKQFSEYVGCSIAMARVTITKAKYHKINYILINGHPKKIEFITLEEEYDQ